LIFQNIYNDLGDELITAKKITPSIAMSVLDGILVVDKPENLTSAGVTNRLKKIPGIRKVGHTGTLDPSASGVLVCTLNQATRLSRFFLDSEKKYRATLELGVETDTQDAAGRVLHTASVENIRETDIRAAFRLFEGEIQQVPPAFSALKHNGRPLYAYARKGTPVIKPARTVSIAYIRFMELALPEVKFEVCCASGTYIRTLCADIGKALGCGGHLKALRRIESGKFSIHEATPLQQIESRDSADALKNNVVPMADSLRHMASCLADKDLVEKIRYGKPLTGEDVSPIADDTGGRFIKLIGKDGRLLAVVERPANARPYNYCCVFL
jgi:tRNA pseudouridine55 synthase